MEGLNYRARWCELYLSKNCTEKGQAGAGREELAGLLKGQCRGPHVWAGQVGAEGCVEQAEKLSFVGIGEIFH